MFAIIISVNIDFDLPAGLVNLPVEPERDYEEVPDWQYKDNKEEIENALRVLNMCDDELIRHCNLWWNI
jgi:hypothetical protein